MKVSLWEEMEFISELYKFCPKKWYFSQKSWQHCHFDLCYNATCDVIRHFNIYSGGSALWLQRKQKT